MAKTTKSAAREERRAKRVRDDTALMIAVEKTPDRLKQKAMREPAIPLNDAQRCYDAAIRSSSIIFGSGPAGTGKTWFAAKRAAEALEEGLIERIVVTRPAVTADEEMGFLPGDLDEKYEPYFRPVKDALVDHFGTGGLEYMIRAGKIEARPLAFLRGSTIKNSWLIADEMQNATRSQFKMLLSRIGENAKFIINGDPAQTDLGSGESGLLDAIKRLRSIPLVESVVFKRSDIVRSGLCQAVVEAYELT